MLAEREKEVLKLIGENKEWESLFHLARRVKRRERDLRRHKVENLPQKIIGWAEELLQEAREEYEGLAQELGANDPKLKEIIFRMGELHDLMHDRCWDFFQKGAFSLLMDLLKKHGMSWRVPKEEGEFGEAEADAFLALFQEESLDYLKEQLRKASTQVEAIGVLLEILRRVRSEFYDVLLRVLSKHVNTWMEEGGIERAILCLRHEEDERLFS